MRLRRKPELHEAIKNYQDIVFLNGYTCNQLDGIESINLEIGMGKGSFLTKYASLEPDKFFLGIESQIEVIYYAACKIRESELANIRILHGNADNIEEWFSAGQVDSIYVNFCDPWPKARHAKRRLVARKFLAKYKKIIKPGGILQFKTDNKDLFAFALEEFAFCGLPLLEESRDLHKSEISNTVWTEYEQKFNQLGMPICYARVLFPDRD